MSTPTADMQEDKPLSYCQRFKQECSQAAGLCLFDRIKDSFKNKEKDGEKQSEAPPPPRSPTQHMNPEAQLQHQQNQYEGQLQTQRDDFNDQVQGLHMQYKQQQISFDQKLAQQEQHTHQQLEEAEKTIKRLKQELQESRERSIEVQNSSEPVQQYEFVVPNFSKLKRDQTKFNPPPMYSRPGGYKFVVEISTRTATRRPGSYISVRVFPRVGDYDENLKFPAKMYITLQLLHHQHKREGHYTKRITCDYKESSSDKCIGSDSFISLEELERNADIYIENDQLCFRITKVKVDTLQKK